MADDRQAVYRFFVAVTAYFTELNFAGGVV